MCGTLISVVMPLYNKEQYVRKTVQSVLEQSYRNFELIIVNDGSTDDSLNVVKNIDDSRIVIIDKENGGVSRARNEGVKHSSADFVAFIDADDFMHRDYLNVITGLIDKCPNAGFYCVPFVLQKENTSVMKAPSDNKELWDYFEFLEKGGVVHSSAVTVRKSVFSEVGLFRPGYKMSEDQDMWLRIGLKYDLGYSDEIHNVWDYTIEDSATKLLSPPIDSPLMETWSEQKESLPTVRLSLLQSYLFLVRKNNVLKSLKLGLKQNAISIAKEAQQELEQSIWYWRVIPVCPRPLLKLLYWIIMLNKKIFG